MGRLVVIANQKGGVGKTTTAINLAIGLAAPNRKILLIDLDPQGNATSGLMPPAQLAELKSNPKTIYEAIVERIPITEAVRKVRDHVFLTPSGADLVGAEIELATMERRERRLKEILAPVRDGYAFILVDTPPSLGLLTLNALVAADSVMVPMQCEYYALEGLSALLGTIARIRKALNPALQIDGLVLTMFDARNRLSHEIAHEVNKHFPDKVFQSVIPRSVRLSESPSHGLSVIEYDAKSSGADAYRQLAAEVLVRTSLANGQTARSEHNGEERIDNGEIAQPQGRRSWSLRALFAREGERARRG